MDINSWLSVCVCVQLDADVLLRHKAVKVITAHGGAFVPYQAYRLAAVGPKGLPGAPERRRQLQSLYFDTTMSGDTLLPAVEALWPDHTGRSASQAVCVEGVEVLEHMQWSEGVFRGPALPA